MVPLETNDMSGALMNVASGENSQLGNLLKGGDVDKASQMSYAVLSVVDGSKDKMAREDKKQVIFSYNCVYKLLSVKEIGTM